MTDAHPAHPQLQRKRRTSLEGLLRLLCDDERKVQAGKFAGDGVYLHAPTALPEDTAREVQAVEVTLS